MEEYVVFDISKLENIKVCVNCNKHLNVSPIYCVERDNKIEEICGRCVNISDGYSPTKKFRQYTYENFGKFLTFPCSNKKFGCKTVLSWNDVVSHENVCTHELVKCPMAQENINIEESCSWKGSITNIKEHIAEAHKTYISSPPQIEWTDFKSDMILFAQVGTEIITIIIKYMKDSTYNCLLMLNGNDIESQCYRYQLEMFDESKNNSILLRKPRLQPLSLMKECLLDPGTQLEIDLIKIKQILKPCKQLTGRFGVVKKSKKEIALITGCKNFETVSGSPGKPKEEKVVDEYMLMELECPVCNDYMIPPIFICRTGHSICSTCKMKVQMCPNCRDHFTGARNFTLEKLTIRVNYPCRNREQGCTFIMKSNRVVQHHLNCGFSETRCLLNCNWQGKRDLMFNHIKEVHPASLNDSNIVLAYDMNTEEDYYFIYDHNELFRFNGLQEMRHNINKFNIQHVGGDEDNPRFRYQLQIIDQSPLKLNMSFTNVCKPLTDLRKACSTGISIPTSMLTPFIFDTYFFYYKITITKIC